jgi:hypothetical protein
MKFNVKIILLNSFNNTFICFAAEAANANYAALTPCKDSAFEKTFKTSVKS